MTDSDQKKLRSDLVLSEQKKGGVISYVLKDPSTERFFRFKEVEGFILSQLDGRTGLEDLRKKVEAKFDAALPPGTLETFIVNVQSLGLLESSGTAELKPKKRRIQGDIFYLRLKLLDPDVLLEKLVNVLGFFFTRWFLIVSAFSVLLAVGVAVNSWNEIQRDVYGLFQSFSLFLAWIIVISVVTLHEFAHGLTCKRFGGHVHEMGFLLIYFMPAFYCNVSDAWLIPEKSKRLWVTFAGGYFEIFIWALATIAWLVTDPTTWVNKAALVVVATSGIKQFFNLNPLIKLDGYYLLSDYLEIPNLRRRAFLYIKHRIRGLFGSASQLVKETTPREAIIYAVYGILSAVYTTWLISSFAIYFGNYLMSVYHGWGFILFVVFLTSLFRNQIKKLLQGLTSMKGLSNILSYIKKPPKLVYAVALVALLFLFRMQLSVSGEFAILPIHNADVRSEVDEIITEVYKDEGDTVSLGDPIVRLSDRDITAELDKITSQIEETEAQLRLLRAGPKHEEIALARTLVEKARERLIFARRDFERDSVLFKRQLLSQKEFDESQELVSVRIKELEEETRKFKVLISGKRPEEIQVIEAAVNRLRAQRRYLEEKRDLLVVRSPAAGVITTPRLREKVGQEAKKGDLIAKVFEQRIVKVEIPISEKDIADVQVGQEVVLKARAYPQLNFSGKVTAIAPVAVREETWSTERTFTVRAELDNPSLLLKAGMSGNAKIYCGQRRLYELLLRRIYHFFRVEVWSWW